MKKKFLGAFFACFALYIIYAKKQGDRHFDYVRDEQTAIKIAEAIWLPIYGESIYSEKPFIATLEAKGTVWYVHGTLPPNHYGGVVYIRFKKYDCQIIEVSHGR